SEQRETIDFDRVPTTPALDDACSAFHAPCMRRKRSTISASIVLALLAVIEGCSVASGPDAAQSTDRTEVMSATDANDPSGANGANGSSGAAAENPADPTPRVRYVGRTDRSDPAGPRVAWPGTRIIVRFRGPALKV